MSIISKLSSWFLPQRVQKFTLIFNFINWNIFFTLIHAGARYNLVLFFFLVGWKCREGKICYIKWGRELFTTYPTRLLMCLNIIYTYIQIKKDSLDTAHAYIYIYIHIGALQCGIYIYMYTGAFLLQYTMSVSQRVHTHKAKKDFSISGWALHQYWNSIRTCAGVVTVDSTRVLWRIHLSARCWRTTRGNMSSRRVYVTCRGVEDVYSWWTQAQ